MEPQRIGSYFSDLPSVATIAALVAMAAIGNSTATAILWDSGNEPWYSFAWGILIAQPCLLSIWCALVRQNLILRVSISMGILFVLYCSMMLTFQLLDVPGGSIPLELILIFLGMIVALTLLIQTPLYIVRRITGYTLFIPSNNGAQSNDVQFGIKHLLIATTVAALLIVIAQATFSSQVEFQGGAPWAEIIGFIATFSVLVTLTGWLCIGAVFLSQHRVAIGALLGFVILAGPWAVHKILTRVFRGATMSETYFNTLLFLVALVGTIVVVLTLFYAIGYRLSRAQT